MKMHTHNKTLETQFQNKIKQLISTLFQESPTPNTLQKSAQSLKRYKNNQVTFSTLMDILSSSNIRIYSKNDLNKLKKLFINNPLSSTNQSTNQIKMEPPTCRIELLLGFLQLVCMQESLYNKYLIISIVKVSDNPSNAGKYYGRKQNRPSSKNSDRQHNPSTQCLNNLIKVLKAKHGHPSNWFRVFGAATVSMSIDKKIFETNLRKFIFLTKCTIECIPGIISIFTNENNETSLGHLSLPSKNPDIKWQRFMKVINTQKNQHSRQLSQKRNHTKSKTVNIEAQITFTSPFWCQNSHISSVSENSPTIQNSKRRYLRSASTKQKNTESMQDKMRKTFISQSKRPATLPIQERRQKLSLNRCLFLEPKSCKLNTRTLSVAGSRTPQNSQSLFFKAGSSLNKQKNKEKKTDNIWLFRRQSNQ